MEMIVGVAAGLLTSVLGWLILTLSLRPRIKASTELRVGERYGRDTRAMMVVRNTGISRLADVSIGCWLLIDSNGEDLSVVPILANSPLMMVLGAWRPRSLRPSRPLGTFHRVITLEVPSPPDERLSKFIAESAPPPVTTHSQLAHALLVRDNYRLLVVCSATDTISSIRGVAFVKTYMPADVLRGSFTSA